jgi:hypothetical protein
MFGPSTARRVVVTFVAVVVASCTPPRPERERTTFDVAVHGDSDGQGLLTNGGDVVDLARAELSLGGLTFFEGDALFARAGRHQRLVDSILSVSAAHAHPGHYTPGEALADMPAVGVVDLLAADAVVVGAEGLTGDYASATIPLTTDIDGGLTLSLRGDVQLASGGSVTFVANAISNVAIEGVSSPVTVDGGLMDVSVDVGELVRRIDFSAAVASAPQDPLDLNAVPQAQNAVERELVAQTTYVITYTPGR